MSKLSVASVLLLLLSSSLVAAQCSSADNACTGRNVTLGDGKCATLPSPCTDGLACTEDQCLNGICKFKATGCDVCLSTCTRDCSGKQCGSDGCGSFCGTCTEGLGCDSSFQCTSAAVKGSCTDPFSFGKVTVGGVSIDLGVVSGAASFTITGDTSASTITHVLTPLCNYRSDAPEAIYSFTIPDGKTYGFEFRTTGFDTVLSVMKSNCRTNATIACNDDATPPGNYGSLVSGLATAGKYFVQVDGYDSTAKGTFTLTGKFVDGCQPKCDGSFCGSDGCGGTCGACDSDKTCIVGRCYNTTCTKRCSAFNRTCGEDACGGSCGTCATGQACVHASVAPDDEEIAAGITVPSSYCKTVPTCDHFAPVCSPACSASQFCGSNCTCFEKAAQLPDFIVNGPDARDDMYIHQLDVTETSCQLVEKCVGGTGKRNLLRFTASSTNQGQVDFTPPAPKLNPQIFEWGTCHQHYHYTAFMQYLLLDYVTGKQVNQKGFKAAFCMEDSRRELDGPNIPCQKKYQCSSQGIQRGWTDSYGWSLDCSWIDVTGVPAGLYYLKIEVNPERRIVEASYTNNAVCVVVNVPASGNFTSIPTRVTGNQVVTCPTSSATKVGILALIAMIAALMF